MSDAKEKFGQAIDKVKNDPVNDEPEKDLWQGKYSAKGMFGSLAVAGVGTFAFFVLMYMFPDVLFKQPAVFWAEIGAILLVWAYLLLLIAYRKLANYYELTSQRLKHRDGILIRTMNRIELLDVDDVIYRQGPIETILNVGNITIKSSDSSHPELVMYGISDVKRVADTIDNARRTERRRRGLHIESI
jgi:membrane protein YdbS with pleckstrin-like domain